MSENHGFENPMQTDGFDFIEFASPDPSKLIKDFEHLGFKAIAKHRSKDVRLFRQGEINFIINNEPNSHAKAFAEKHGAGACAMGFRVKDAEFAFKRAVELGAKPFEDSHYGEGELRIHAIYGIGDSLIYFIDKYATENIYDIDFIYQKAEETQHTGAGLKIIDHLTHNVKHGEMDKWAGFYEKLFNFREIRFFDIKGQQTGLISRALTSPCGKIRIPINEPTDDKSQIAEFVDEFNGEGIQHIALSTENIYRTVEDLKNLGIKFLNTPDTYFDMIIERVPWHKEDLESLRKHRILLDGTPTPEGGLLLQIFTHNMLGPVFFEIIQRKGNEGFGEGNFQALFEAIERDQIARGVLTEK
ncbi:MAG: 4-hydroxyphenylpyruvate dioxygenase [Pseudomonadota bacterium]